MPVYGVAAHQQAVEFSTDAAGPLASSEWWSMAMTVTAGGEGSNPDL